jgi:SAM-dependent methyltransferase
MRASVRNERVIWHDVECGAYDADLSLWRELARAYPDRVLELGSGTGRVALDLARAGNAVTAVDSDAELVAALRSRAGERDLEVTAHVADARTLSITGEFGLILAPMQMIQLVLVPHERLAVFRAARSLLRPGGCLAIAIVEGVPGDDGNVSTLPDVAEIDRWVYSSLPLDIADRGESMVVTRLRQVVSPEGVLTDSVDETRLAVVSADGIEAEGRTAGLRPVGRREVATTDAHVGSTVVLLESGE